MIRILVTGATGFIGSNCLPILLARGNYEVHAVSSRPVTESREGIYWHQADLLDRLTVSKLIEEVRPSHLLHFAWYVVPNEYWTSGVNLRWVQASLSLLLEFAKCGGRRVVMAGTCAEYDWEPGFCAESYTPTRPVTLYGVCKKSLCDMLLKFCDETKLSAAWGRIFYPYGPYERQTRLVPSVINCLLRKERVRCSHGNQVRDFLHVKDVADAFVTVMESEAYGPVNIASGIPVTINQVVEFLAKSLGGQELVEFGSVTVSENEPSLLLADVRRLSEQIGWSPQYDLEKGLTQTIRWWEERLC